MKHCTPTCSMNTADAAWNLASLAIVSWMCSKSNPFIRSAAR